MTPRTLRQYVIREVTLPTLVSLFAITFILIVGRIFDLISLLLQPAVSLGEVLAVMLRILPQILVLTIPMAIMLGLLVGVGRMALDREILAARATGINIFAVFLPSLVLALLLSGALIFLSSSFIPRFLLDGMKRLAELQFTVIDSLDAGRFHEDLGGEEGGFILYFQERDETSRQMQGVVVKLDNQFSLGRPGPEATPAPRPDGTPTAAPTPAPTPAPADVPSTATATPLPTPPPLMEVPVPLDERNRPIMRDENQSIIFARRGGIRADFNESDEAAVGRLVIELEDGSIHRLAETAPFGPLEYLVMPFTRLQKVLVFSSFLESLRQEQRTRTNGELRAMAAGVEESAPRRGEATAELTRRFSLGLASFVFALVGIPLAIWVRQSGRFLGIVIALALMITYYFLMQWGLTLIKGDKTGGMLVAYAPNLLFLFLGALLWRQTLRS